MIECSNLTKVYYTEELETVALNNINLTIKEGDFIAIMGPSGCGKSTLLNMLGLIDIPSDGSYLFEDIDLVKLNDIKKTEFRRDNIGFIFQDFNLLEELDVYENIELPLLYQKRSTQERKVRVNDVLERVGISHRKNHQINQLSGGQQQRVAVARALVTKPKLILADEPTGNLDSKNGEDVMKLLEELNADGTTIAMVTHSPSHAKRAHRTVNLFDGKIGTDDILI